MTEAQKLIQQFEGCVLTAYKCPAGKWTIGWGETEGIKEGMTWTQAQADSALQKRIAELKSEVIAACPYLEAHPHRLGACISLAYNIGIGNFSSSSVARYIRRGEYKAAADAFGMWVFSGKQKLTGLVRRRQAEREVFLKDGY